MPADERSFQRLDPGAVQKTVDRLVMRITRRFPDRNLRLVAAELSGLVGEVSAQSSVDRRRNRAIGLACRVAAITIVTIAITAIILAIHDALPESGEVRGFQWLSVLDRGVLPDVAAQPAHPTSPARAAASAAVAGARRRHASTHQRSGTATGTLPGHGCHPDVHAGRCETGELPRLLQRDPVPGGEDRRTLRRGIDRRVGARHGQRSRDADRRPRARDMAEDLPAARRLTSSACVLPAAPGPTVSDRALTKSCVLCVGAPALPWGIRPKSGDRGGIAGLWPAGMQR